MEKSDEVVLFLYLKNLFLLNGEYGFNDVYAGVPVKLGAEGIEEVIEVDLNTKEQDALSKSVDSVIELLEIMEENS